MSRDFGTCTVIGCLALAVRDMGGVRHCGLHLELAEASVRAFDAKGRAAAAGIKFDDGKLPMSLIPPEAQFAEAAVLLHGARKYTMPVSFDVASQQLVDSCSCGIANRVLRECQREFPNVIPDGSTGHGECVKPATTEPSSRSTQSTLSDSGKVVGDGTEKTPSMFESTKQTTGESSKTKSELRSAIERDCCPSTDLHSKTSGQSCELSDGAAPSAEIGPVASGSISTMTTPPINSGGLFADVAIRASDCLEILRRACVGHSATCSLHRKNLPRFELNNAGKLCHSGEHNWRKGIAYSRLIDAAMRHLAAWSGAEDLDPESGLSHLAHARCCIGFLLAYEVNGPKNDDRYRLFHANPQIPPVSVLAVTKPPEEQK